MFITVSLFVPSLGRRVQQKKTLSHFPYLGFETVGHRTKAVRFWAHKRARPTSCKIKQRNYSIVY